MGASKIQLKSTKNIWTATSNESKFKAKVKTTDGLPSMAPLGYDKMQRLARRPRFDKWPRRSKDIATLIKYAKKNDNGCMARFSRIQWITPKWQASVMGERMDKLSQKLALASLLAANGNAPNASSSIFHASTPRRYSPVCCSLG